MFVQFFFGFRQFQNRSWVGDERSGSKQRAAAVASLPSLRYPFCSVPGRSGDGRRRPPRRGIAASAHVLSLGHHAAESNRAAPPPPRRVRAPPVTRRGRPHRRTLLRGMEQRRKQRVAPRAPPPSTSPHRPWPRRAASGGRGQGRGSAGLGGDTAKVWCVVSIPVPPSPNGLAAIV